MSVSPWFAQPGQPLGTAILLPGRWGGVATPVMHWPASLLTEGGWSVLAVTWDEERIEREGATSEVLREADAAFGRALPGRPVLVVAKSMGTLALPWALQHRLPGVWLTPLLRDPAVVRAVGVAQQRTLLVGGTEDPHWQPPNERGPGVTVLELPEANHGLQQPGHWRRSLAQQVEVFDQVSRLADRVLQRGGLD